MFNNLKQLFSPDAPDTQDKQNTSHERVKIATCVILLEIAYADDDFCDEERKKIIEMLGSRFLLSPDEATELIEYASAARSESRDLWQFANQINETCSKDEKMGIIEEVWRVVFADGGIGGHENHLTHQLGRLLNLTHGQVIDLKLKVLDELRA